MKTLLLFTCAAFSTMAIAQKSTSKKVDTRFINIPNYDVSSTDVSSLSSSFAVGSSSYGANKLKDTKSTCLPKGGSLKDAKELTTYYYEHAVTRPDAYIFLKDANGATVYASQISKTGMDKADYGKDKCEHWMKTTLEKNYKAGKASWETSDHNSFVSSIKEKANRELNGNGVISYNPIEFEVYSAKGKGLDYGQLESAYDMAYDAYETINKKGVSAEAFEKLKKAIDIWKSEVEKADMENKDARINKKIAQGLYINLTYAYFTILDMDNAAIYAQKADQSFGNFTNNARTEIQALRNDINRRKAGISKNSSLVSNPSKLNELASSNTSTKFTLAAYTGTIEDATSDYYAFAGEEMAVIAESTAEANIAAGGTSYDKYVVANSVPKTLTIMKLQETLTEFPVGITQIEDLGSVVINANDIAKIPAEIGKMTSLKKLFLAKNKISELPDEIGNCTNLSNLNLNGNPIERLPESIKNCTKLKTINLKGTKVSAEHVAEIEGWLPKCKVKI